MLTRTSWVICPPSAPSGTDRRESSICPPIRSSIAGIWYRDKAVPSSRETNAVKTEADRLLQDSRIEELATLIDGSSGNQQTVDVLTRLAAQRNKQRKSESIADNRYEVRWEKSTAGVSNAPTGEGSAWVVIGDDADALRPLVDALIAHGHRHRIFGLPVSDADEAQLEVALRAAAADEPTLRILHVVAPDSDTASLMRPLLRMQHRVLGGTRRLFRAAVAAELRSAIWLVTRGHNASPTRTPCRRIRVAFGDSVVPRRWSIRRCGEDWRICPKAVPSRTATTGCGRG